jgi:hypothetical protein
VAGGVQGVFFVTTGSVCADTWTFVSPCHQGFYQIDPDAEDSYNRTVPAINAVRRGHILVAPKLADEALARKLAETSLV